MVLGATILRVGALAVLVGQAACSGAARPLVVTAPELDIPRLDGGAPVALEDGIRFGHPLPTVGTAWTVSVHATSVAEEQVSTYISEYRVEILAVDGPAPSRVKLRFVRNVHSYQGHDTPTVIEGKEYVVDARAPHVRDATNAAAPEPETQRVLDVFPDLGTRTRIDEVLPDRAMHIGERRDELAAAILRVIHPRAWTLREGRATLVRLDGNSGDDAVFKVSIDASSESGLTMDVSGEAHVRLADAHLTDLSLDGRYVLTKTGTATPEPPGKFNLRRRITSEAAPRSGR